MDGFATGELNANGLVAVHEHARDAGLVANLAAVALEAAHQFPRNRANAAFGVVDAAGMAIGKHHAGIDHRGEIRWHHRPAEALHVNELEQLGIVDVLAGHIANVERQPAGKA